MKNKIKGSTIIETIIALIIIMLIYGFVLNFYLGVLKKAKNSDLVSIHYILKKDSTLDLKLNNNSESEYKNDSTLIEKTVVPYKENENLLLVSYKYRNTNNRVLLERKIIILKVP